MPQDDKDRHDNRAEQAPQQSAYPEVRKIFKVPGPVRQLFDKFPLITYPANELPQRLPQNREKHTLYIFTTQNGAKNGVPSFNPSCLKWQVCLP